MAKLIWFLIQAIITFVIGVVLVNHGMPSSVNDWVLQTGEELASPDASDPAPISGTEQTTYQMMEMIGYTISILSLIEFVLTLIILLISAIFRRQ